LSWIWVSFIRFLEAILDCKKSSTKSHFKMFDICLKHAWNNSSVFTVDICFKWKGRKDFKKLQPLQFFILTYFTKEGHMTLEMANLLDVQFQVVSVYRKELKEQTIGGWKEMRCHCETQGKLKSLNHVLKVHQCLPILVTYTLLTTPTAITDSKILS
jgi:hypothetical protein